MMFAIPNLSAHSVIRMASPLDFKPNVPDEVKVSKKAIVDWRILPTTKHCFYSMVEGSNPSMRVDPANQPYVLHGFIADYDSHNIQQSTIDALATAPESEWMPSWSSRTYSGGARLMWEFERPIRVPGPTLMKEFLHLARKKLRLSFWLPGLDEDAFMNVAQYYDYGDDWKPVQQDYRISYNSLSHWMYEAGGRIDWSTKLYRIPMNEVAKAVEERFPGRWKGEFQIDARGVRFWDPQADNPTGAIVRESGMQCFTGPEPFMSWPAIFGQKFMEKYQSKQIGLITAESFYDGKEYWRKNSQNLWVNWSKEDFKLHLRINHKLRGGTGDKKQNEPGSEIDRVMAHIHEHNRVEAALPFVHMPEGTLPVGGLTYLNISTTRCMEPADSINPAWGADFPWVAGFLDRFFDPVLQKDYFLSWLHHFYTNARLYKPQSGQAIFIVGEPGVGKTLLSSRIISRMVGGHSDASSFLLGDERFTASVLSHPVMTVDDTVPATDSVRHTRYSSMLKKLVANRWVSYEQKFQKAGKVVWLGRIIVTCNSDPQSIRLLPDMDLSILDKVSLFKCNDQKTDFPRSDVLEEVLDRELPHFCRWIMDYEIPTPCKGDARYWVAPYHHPLLYKHSLQSSNCYNFFELLQAFLKLWGESSGKEVWEGTGTDLMAAMAADEGLRSVAVKYTPSSVGMMLGQLKSRGYPLVRSRVSKGRRWEINVNIDTPDNMKQEEEVQKEETDEQ